METVEEGENSSNSGDSSQHGREQARVTADVESKSSDVNTIVDPVKIVETAPPRNVEDVSSAPPLKASGSVVKVPAGKLGITIDTSKGMPVIYSVDGDSSVAGKLKPGDVILAIDDVDTSAMVATAIAALIAAKAEHERRFVVQSGKLFRRLSF
jgi:predicted metalloprotease with PDZ domain